MVEFSGDYAPGSIVVVNAERALYYVLGNDKALRYPVAIGTPDEVWTGQSVVTRKRKNPGWGPTRSQRRADPTLPRYVPAGPDNPLGARALYLGWGVYRIHGTNEPKSIGFAQSNGCIRMFNTHVSDLYERVHIGAPVHVIERLNAVVSGR
ncbi:MAG: L,D-transpeptidase [Hyphomicrobiales bacterium]